MLYEDTSVPIIFADANPEGVAFAKAKIPILTSMPPQSPRAKKSTMASLVFKVSWACVNNKFKTIKTIYPILFYERSILTSIHGQI